MRYFLEPLHPSYRNLVRTGFFTDELFCLSGRWAVIGSFRRIHSAVIKNLAFQAGKIYDTGI